MTDLRDIPGLKKKELLKLSTCFLCRQKIFASHPLGIFYRVTVDRFMVDIAACQRSDALGTLVGSNAIADVLGPDEDLAKTIMKQTTVSICETCALEPSGEGFRTRIPYLFSMLIEQAGKEDTPEVAR